MPTTPSRGAVATAVAVALVAALGAGSIPAFGAGAPDGERDQRSDDVAATGSVPNGTNATVMVAPRGSADRLTSVAAIERGREAGWLTPSPVLAAGDTLAFRLRLPGMAERVANATGDTDDARFRSVLAGENVSLRVVQRHVSPHRDRQIFSLNGSRGQTVVADPGNDIYYVAADLADVPDAAGDPGTDAHLRYGEFVPRLVVGGEHRLNPGSVDEPNRTGRFVVLERDATLTGADRSGRLVPGLAAAPNQTVTGYTALAPGSTVTVRVTNVTGIEAPRTATARVTRETVDPDEWGPPKFAFETALNLSDVQPGTEIGLVVTSNGTVVDDQYEQDRFRAPVDASGAAVELLTAGPIRNGAVRIHRATLPGGGFVTVVRQSDDTVVGSSDYLDPGTHEGLRVSVSEHVAGNSTLRVSLAHDSDGDGNYFRSADRHYAGSMRPVGATVSWNATAAAIDTRTAPNATVLVAPSGTGARLQSVADIERARANGTVTPQEFVALGDTFVLELQAPGITGAVANESGSTADARFRSFLDRPNVSLGLAWTETGPERPPYRFRLDGSSARAAVADPANDTYYVTADLLTLPYTSPGDDWQTGDPPLFRGVEPALVFEVNGSHRLPPVDGDDSNDPVRFAVTDGQVDLVGDTSASALDPGLAAAPNQTVFGVTSFAPGTRLTVSAANATGTVTPHRTTARVYRSGTYGPDIGDAPVFRTGFDLSDVEPGTTLTLTIREEGGASRDAYESDPFSVPVDSPRAAVEPAGDPLANGTVRVANATLPDGGFVVAEGAGGGPVLGASEYLDAGTHRGLGVGLNETARNESAGYHVFLAHDSDGDGNYSREVDRAYADSMNAVGVTVSRSNVANETETQPDDTTDPTDSGPTATVASPTPTATPHSDPTTTPGATETATGTADPTTTSGDGPGFGAVAALIGIVGAAILAARRRESRE